MKQYRCIANTPTSTKGIIYIQSHFFRNSQNVWVSNDDRYAHQFVGDPSNWPDIFEEIEVKTDENILSEWLLSCDGKHPNRMMLGTLNIAAQSLLSENAINPEFLKKLRGEG